MFLSSKSNTTGATSGPGNGYSSGSPVFNQGFFVMFVFLDIYFSVFCSFLPLFVLVLLLVAIVLSILYRLAASDLTTPLVSSTLSYILHLTGICLIMFSFVYWLCVVLDLLLTEFVLFLVVIVLSAIRPFTASDYHFNWYMFNYFQFLYIDCVLF